MPRLEVITDFIIYGQVAQCTDVRTPCCWALHGTCMSNASTPAPPSGSRRCRITTQLMILHRMTESSRRLRLPVTLSLKPSALNLKGSPQEEDEQRDPFWEVSWSALKPNIVRKLGEGGFGQARPDPPPHPRGRPRHRIPPRLPYLGLPPPEPQPRHAAHQGSGRTRHRRAPLPCGARLPPRRRHGAPPKP